jgi:hypothetical protein
MRLSAPNLQTQPRRIWKLRQPYSDSLGDCGLPVSLLLVCEDKPAHLKLP